MNISGGELLVDIGGVRIKMIEHGDAGFQVDALALSHPDVLGADRVMWASDYPHTEGPFGLSAKVMAAIMEQIGPADAKLVPGGNARRIFAF